MVGTGGDTASAGGLGGATSGGRGGTANAGGTATAGDAGADLGGAGGSDSPNYLCEGEVCDEGLVCYPGLGCTVLCGGSTVFSTTEEVLAFAERGCEVIAGDLWIGGEELLDLRGLEPGSLRVVGGDLTIAESSRLQGVEGLETLERIGGSVSIYDNQSLVSLTGLDGVDSVGPAGTRLEILRNPRLESVPFLARASALFLGVSVHENDLLFSLDIGGVATLGSFNVDQNPSLTSIALPSLEEGGMFQIIRGAALRSISMPNLKRITNTLTIAEHPLLNSLGDTAGWESIELLNILRNPSFPQCEVDALEARFHSCQWCAQNDDAAICD